MPEPFETRVFNARHLKAAIEAERTGLPFLLWLDRDGEQHILMLAEDRGRVTIGRRDQSDVPLSWDPEVSRTHAMLEPVGEEWTLVDDGLSRNGSFVNGNRVHGRHRLQDRDRMCFGNTHVTYRAATPGEGSESTARAPGAPGGVPLTETQRKLLIALCRPIVESSTTTPATNPQIAAEVHLSVDAVKAHMRHLFERYDLGDLPQNEKRTRLVTIVLGSGVLVHHDF
jgi:FHA domain